MCGALADWCGFGPPGPTTFLPPHPAILYAASVVPRGGTHAPPLGATWTSARINADSLKIQACGGQCSGIGCHFCTSRAIVARHRRSSSSADFRSTSSAESWPMASPACAAWLAATTASWRSVVKFADCARHVTAAAWSTPRLTSLTPLFHVFRCGSSCSRCPLAALQDRMER